MGLKTPKDVEGQRAASFRVDHFFQTTQGLTSIKGRLLMLWKKWSGGGVGGLVKLVRTEKPITTQVAKQSLDIKGQKEMIKSKKQGYIQYVQKEPKVRL